MDVNTIIKENPSAPPKRSLTAHDRCDACGAQALVQVRLSAGDLAWCKHHFERNEVALAGAGAEVITDDRDALAHEEGSSHSIR